VALCALQAGFSAQCPLTVWHTACIAGETNLVQGGITASHIKEGGKMAVALPGKAADVVKDAPNLPGKAVGGVKDAGKKAVALPGKVAGGIMGAGAVDEVSEFKKEPELQAEQADEAGGVAPAEVKQEL
jgi:hypothetical protein